MDNRNRSGSSSLHSSAEHISIPNWNEQWLSLMERFGFGSTHTKLIVAHQLFQLTRKFEKEASEIGKVIEIIYLFLI